MTIDHDEIEEEARGPHIPVGHYRARAVSGSAQLAHSEKGTAYIMLMFEITDESYAHLKGQFVSWCGFFSEKTEARTLESLRLAGWSNDDIDEPQGIGDTEVSITVEHSEWNGKVSARVAWVNRPGTGIKVKSPMSPADRKAFAAKMRGKAIISRQGGTPARSPAAGNSKKTAPAGAIADDDKLPF